MARNPCRLGRVDFTCVISCVCEHALWVQKAYLGPCRGCPRDVLGEFGERFWRFLGLRGATVGLLGDISGEHENYRNQRRAP